MSDKDKPSPSRPPSKWETRPTCPNCQLPMKLADMVAGLGHLAGRIFECNKCGHVHIAPESKEN